MLLSMRAMKKKIIIIITNKIYIYIYIYIYIRVMMRGRHGPQMGWDERRKIRSSNRRNR